MLIKQSILKRQKHQLKRKRRLIIYVALPLLFLLALWLLQFFFVINITSSMPIGLYQKSFSNKVKLGSYVGVCLNDYEAKLAIKNGILIENNQCPSGADLLVKEVIALPNDDVEVTDKHLIVTHRGNKLSYIAPRFMYSPKTHKPIVTFIDLGKYQSKGYWVYGSNNKTYSWDSRYFGQLKREDIKYVLKPLLIYRSS